MAGSSVGCATSYGARASNGARVATLRGRGSEARDQGYGRLIGFRDAESKHSLVMIRMIGHRQFHASGLVDGHSIAELGIITGAP